MSKNNNNNLVGENMLFDLLNGFMSICSPGFQNQEKAMQQWGKFKDLITNRPIDYHQVFTFISRMQENDTAPSQNSQLQNQLDKEFDEQQSSSSSSFQNTDTLQNTNARLHHSQKHNNFQSSGSIVKENGTTQNKLQNSQQNNGQFNYQNSKPNVNNNNIQTNVGQQQSQQQGRTNNFVKNTQSTYQNNNGKNSFSSNDQSQNNQMGNSNPSQQQHSQPSSTSSSAAANNNYFNSTVGNPQNNNNTSNQQTNQQSNQNSFNNELFAGSSMNMFKTTAGNMQSNTIQNQKKGEARSSTRDQFNQNPSNMNNNNNFNGISSMNMYNSSGNNNPSSSRNNYRSSFNTTSGNNSNNGNQQSNQKNPTGYQSAQNNVNNSNFANTGGVQSIANMYSSKENYSHFNNNGNTLEKNSPMNPSKFTSSFKGGNTHSIYSNNPSNNQNNEINNQLTSQQSQQSPERTSTSKNTNKHQNPQSNNNNNNNNNGIQSNNLHGLPNETSTFIKDENLYQIQSFSEFLKEHTKIQSLGKNTQFAQTSVLELQNNSNSLLKLASIAFFVNLINELPHPESAPNTTCATSKMQLIEIFLKVYNKKLKIPVSSTHIFTSEQLVTSFTKNTGLLIQLYLLHGQNTSKLVKAFLYQVQHDPLYLDSLVILIKEIASEFVEECDYEAIASILMSQQQQQQQNSLSSTSGSFSQLSENKNVQNLAEKERRAKLAQKLRQPSWKEVKPEWLFLLSLSLQRPIELFNLRDNKLEQTLFKSKKMQISEITANNKINIVTVTHPENKFPVYYLMTMKQSETELYASLKINFKKNDLKLNEEVNFPYLLKQINREKEQYTQQQQQSQPQTNTPSQAQQTQQQLSPTSQQQNQQTLPQSNSNTNLTKEYPMGHRSSKLGLHLNQLQQQQSNALQQSINSNSTNQQHYHNSSVEDQGRKSHSIKTNPVSNLNTNGSTSNLNNPSQLAANTGASSPRMHNLMMQNNQNSLQNQTSGSQPDKLQQPYQLSLQQQQAPSLSSQDGKQNPLFSKIANKFSHYENISPKYNLNNLNFQKSTVNPRSQQSTNSLSQDEWNKNLLYAKMKDLIFTLNINSEQLNSLARFSISHNQNGVQSKENIQPKSPLKYKSVLYPINGNGVSPNIGNQTPTSTQNINNQNGGIYVNGFNNSLNNIMIGSPNQNSINNGGQSITSTAASYSQQMTNNLNNTSSSTATTLGNTSNPNISNFLPSGGLPYNNNPSLLQNQSPFNVSSNSKLNTNNIASASPSSNLGINPLLLNSTNTNNFTSSFGKSGNNNLNGNGFQTFLNSNNFNLMQQTNQITPGNLQQLNTQSGSLNMSSSLNGISNLTSNNALNSVTNAQTAAAPGTVQSKRIPNTYTNNINFDAQQREIFNKLSPRRNLNTQY